MNLQRLGTITPEEILFRANAAAGRSAQRLSVALRGSGWTREWSATALARHVLDEDMRALIRHQEWAAVAARLEQELRNRPSRFVLDPAAARRLTEAITERWPDAPAAAAIAADAILDGKFDLLGFRRLSFARDGAAIDWHFDPVHGRAAPRRFWTDVPFLDPQYGDHKIIWELNRHQYLLALGRAAWLTGEDRYATAIPWHIQSWLAANPPLFGINWASMLELAFRALSWVAAIHFLQGDVTATVSGRAPVRGSGRLHSRAIGGAWLLDAFIGLDRQLSHVEQNMSYYFSPNTHLTGEALALYVAGVALPELARSPHWTDVGRSVLLREAGRQIHADGGHVERSTYYHRYTLDFYTLALLTAECAGDSDAAAVFRDAVERLTRFMTAMADDSGWIPLIGDDDGGMLWPIAGRDPRDVRDSLALAALLLDRPADLAAWDVPEEVFWLGWSARAPVLRASGTAAGIAAPAAAAPDIPITTRAFTDTGYAVMRSASGDHLIFDVGCHGFLNGGHAHADALAVTLTVRDRPLLIDPGTGTYTMAPALRDRMRESVSHNTVTLDGRSSAVPSGPFAWATRADAQLVTWRVNPRFAWAEAFHDGYDDARCRRSVVRAPGGWLIIDDITGLTRRTLQAHWHIDPSWQVTCEGTRRLRAADAAGTHLWILWDEGDLLLAHGDEATGLGWCSPRYGIVAPAWSARVTREAALSASLVTWIGEIRGADTPRLERMRHDCDGDVPAIVARLRHGTAETVTILRPGDKAVRHERRCDTADYHTDARLLQYSIDSTGGVTLSIADAACALAVGGRLVSVDAECHVSDLHLAVRDGRLQLWSSSPPAQLRMQGDAVAGVGSISLNGRELTRPGAADRSMLVVRSADWGEPAV